MYYGRRMISFIKKAGWFDEKIRFYSAGVFFLLTQILILSALLPHAETRTYIFWVCNNFSLLLAIACFQRNIQFVKGVSYVALLPQILWIIDFISHFFGLNVLTISDYILTEGYTYANEVSIFVHLFVPVFIIAFSVKYHPEVKSLLYAFSYILGVYLSTILLTPSSEDINCVFEACRLKTYLPYHMWLWPIYASFLILFAYVIHHVLYFGWKKIHSPHPIIPPSIMSVW